MGLLPWQIYGIDHTEHVITVDDAESLQLSIDTITSLWNAWKERFEVKGVKADEQLLKLFKPMSQDSASELQHMINGVIMSLRLRKTIDLKLGSRSEMFLVNLLCSLLHAETRKAFQLQLKPTVYPKWSEMLTFLKARYHSLENYEQMSPAKPTIRLAVQHNIKHRDQQRLKPTLFTPHIN
jgi:hypothetical protein